MILGRPYNMWRTGFWMKRYYKTETSPRFNTSSYPHADNVEQTVLMHRDLFYRVLWCLYVSVCECVCEFLDHWWLTCLSVCKSLFSMNGLWRGCVELSLACWSFLWFSCWWRINWIYLVCLLMLSPSSRVLQGFLLERIRTRRCCVRNWFLVRFICHPEHCWGALMPSSHCTIFQVTGSLLFHIALQFGVAFGHCCFYIARWTGVDLSYFVRFCYLPLKQWVVQFDNEKFYLLSSREVPHCMTLRLGLGLYYGL